MTHQDKWSLTQPVKQFTQVLLLTVAERALGTARLPVATEVVKNKPSAQPPPRLELPEHIDPGAAPTVDEDGGRSGVSALGSRLPAGFGRPSHFPHRHLSAVGQMKRPLLKLKTKLTRVDRQAPGHGIASCMTGWPDRIVHDHQRKKSHGHDKPNQEQDPKAQKFTHHRQSSV